ncbi:hypothetical protein GCM10011321_22810 [Youhaiella tibetensis]|uniref:Uncharacterized protein n=1 Tax=Paradevosia tibetensis TaxID=1447062 RepID=A0A5B9DKK0_9HYPH|nr:hypothetical protein [Youhaiella tibetensis]QEE19677.1 hypothetical protein FNA67_05585 [Youhaiella tibetensis]GGF30960.1 hypothetical protein GCM10011321_22810 [Youhaiella tibetensis]
MKIRNLLLGSIAAAGLATGAQAADLGVLTSLDVCDSLGLSGLTISSDTNCLQITGEVKYEFNWGDYRTSNGATPAGSTGAVVVGTPAGAFSIADNNGDTDWGSKVEAWIKFVATADSDFGPAKAVLKIRQIQEQQWTNSTVSELGDNEDLHFNEAYVSIGDSTVIMAGKKGSIINKGDDEPFNFLGLFNSEKVDVGVGYNDGLSDTDGTKIKDGGHVIQIVSDLGNGLSVGAGLEALNQSSAGQAGTAVGVISYAGESLTAHATFMAGGILDGDIKAYAVHAGMTGTFDNFKVRGAFAANNDLVNSRTNWEALASAQATFDMFTLALSGEVENVKAVQSWGFGASAGFAVTDGITINLGGRFFDSDTNTANTEGYQIAAQLVAAVTETLKLTGEIGVYGSNSGLVPPAGLGGTAGTYENVFYGAAEVAWAPGGDFTASLKGQAFSNGGYKATFKAAKTFQ